MGTNFRSTTSWAAIFATIGTGALAGNLERGLDDPVVTPPPTPSCLGINRLELKAGALSTDNVWSDDIATLQPSIPSLDPIFDKLGLGDAVGGFGEAEYAWDRCGSDLSIGAGFVTTSMDEQGSNAFGEAQISDAVSFQHLDLEYGRFMGTELRVFGGLRVLNYESDSAYQTRATFPGFEVLDAVGFAYGTRATFAGIGPRLGIEFNTSTRERGAFGFFGEASVAALYGERNNAFWIEDLTNGPVSRDEETTDEMLVNFDAELGVSYNISDSAVLNAGLAYKRINDIDWISDTVIGGGDTFPAADGSYEASDRMFIGAFIGFEKHF